MTDPDRNGSRNRYRGVAAAASEVAAEALRSAADAMTGEARTTTRVQLEMPPQAMERLQKLKERTEAASYAEVIRNALRLFEALIEEHEKGSEFSIKRPNGETLAYKIFM